MRVSLLISVLGFAAGLSGEKEGACLVDGGEAVSDALDASLYVWAASKRCGKPGQDLKCAIDASSAVKAVTSMIDIILRAVDKCDALKTAHKECGLAAGDFVKNAAGLAAASADVVQKCPLRGAPAPAVLGVMSSPIMCTIDVKDSAKGLLKLVSASQANQAACKNQGLDCDHNILDIVGSIGGMGAYVAGAVGQCRRTALFGGNSTTDTRHSLCAQAASALLEYLMEISKDGIKLHQACTDNAPKARGGLPDTVVAMIQKGRLYEEGEDADNNGSKMNLAFAAFLPVIGIASFVVGRFYAARSQNQEYTRDLVMTDHE